MRTYEKCVRKSPELRTYKIIGLNVPWNEHLRKKGGWGGTPQWRTHLPSVLPNVLVFLHLRLSVFICGFSQSPG